MAFSQAQPGVILQRLTAMDSDWSNFGQWSEAGSKTASEWAQAIWKRKLAEFETAPVDAGVAEAQDDFVARRTAAPRLGIEGPVD